MTSTRDYFGAFAWRAHPTDAQLLRDTVGPDGVQLRALLSKVKPSTLERDAIRTQVEGDLWMLSAAAFQYFLPAFLTAALDHYEVLSVFVSELIGALTEPSREDVVQSLDAIAKLPAGLGLPAETLAPLRGQQLEWHDSGTPTAMFRERVAGLTPGEGAVILAFFVELQDRHGGDFPFDELQIAMDRTWRSYQ